MIKVISIDIGGTLIELKANSESKNYDIRSLADIVNKPYDLVRTAYKDVFQKTNGNFDYLVNLFCKKLDIILTEKLEEFFKNKFSSSESGFLSKDNIEVIKELKKKGYKIILFSNNCCLMKNNVTDEILNLVDRVFYSYDIGYTKNDSESYKYIEKELNNEPSEFLHVGDTLSSDYLSPIENGWNAIYYGDSGDEHIKQIANLKQISKFL